jgi:hypothetical protein
MGVWEDDGLEIIAPEEEYDTPIHVECHNNGNLLDPKPKP